MTTTFNWRSPGAWLSFWPNVLAVMIYLISVASVLLLLSQASGQVTSIWPLLFIVAIAPGLLTVVVFAAYRVSYRRDTKGDAQRILAWRRYALPLSMLMSFTTFFSAAVLWEEIIFSSEAFETGFTFGMFSIPIYFNGENITNFPSLVLWGAYAGFLVIFMSATLMRFVNKSIVPHFYLGSTFRLISGLFGAALWWLLLNAASLNNPLNEARVVDPYVAILGAFVVGAATNDFINMLISRIGRLVGIYTGDELSLSAVQGIDPTLAVYLQDEGITTIQVLATAGNEFLERISAVDDNTRLDWKNQAYFLRNFSAHEVVRAFHALGINELIDVLDQFEDIDEGSTESKETRIQELANALVTAGEFSKKPYNDAGLFVVMLRNLYHEAKRQRDITAQQAAVSAAP